MAGQKCHRVDLLVLRWERTAPDANIRGVHLHDELVRGLRKDEHRGRGEQALEGREGALGLRGPGEGTEGRGEGSKRGSDPAEAADEASVKVSKPKETSELGAVSGPRPLFHHPHLIGVSSHLSLLQDVAEELHRGCVEHALLGLHEEPVLQQSLEDQTDVGGVFLRGRGKKVGEKIRMSSR